MAGRPRQENGQVQGAAASLLNGLAVLEAFSVQNPVLGVTEVAQRVGLHKSTVSRILGGLTEAGYVQRDEETGRYRLGLGLLALSGPLLADLDVRRAAVPYLEQLTESTQETSAISVWNGHEAIVVEQVPSPYQVKHTATIGTRYNKFESSSVRVFLAELAPALATELIESGRILRTAGDGLPLDHTTPPAGSRPSGIRRQRRFDYRGGVWGLRSGSGLSRQGGWLHHCIRSPFPRAQSTPPRTLWFKPYNMLHRKYHPAWAGRLRFRADSPTLLGERQQHRVPTAFRSEATALLPGEVFREGAPAAGGGLAEVRSIWNRETARRAIGSCPEEPSWPSAHWICFPRQAAQPSRHALSGL